LGAGGGAQPLRSIPPPATTAGTAWLAALLGLLDPRGGSTRRALASGPGRLSLVPRRSAGGRRRAKTGATPGTSLPRAPPRLARRRLSPGARAQAHELPPCLEPAQAGRRRLGRRAAVEGRPGGGGFRCPRRPSRAIRRPSGELAAAERGSCERGPRSNNFLRWVLLPFKEEERSPSFSFFLFVFFFLLLFVLFI
jgi:hypothetical protein